MTNNTNTNWSNPTNYWANTNWNNPLTSLLTNNQLPNWNNNPFNSNPLTTGLTTLVNNTPTTPLVNAYETTESYVLELLTPGYNKDSFEVSYNNNNLTVRANVEKNERTNYSYREFNYASFTREFALPNNVDTTETRAKYDNGILTILLPKTTTNSNYRTVKIS
jgi:HSP20 family molecular chaperone IbpA